MKKIEINYNEVYKIFTNSNTVVRMVTRCIHNKKNDLVHYKELKNGILQETIHSITYNEFQSNLIR